jgi:type VI protein secretion system component VasK
MDDYVRYLSEFSPWYLVLLALLLFVWVFPLWRIIGKAGYPPVLSLLAIFPAVGLILLWWLAFAQWPIWRDAPVSLDARVPARGKTSW